ncbi:hypothetical protein [Pedobacter sp. JCM 36344]|uniref:hypothetical protein n=1 Tax=Pedobacter sp. JCM 36344 TaxID=3374280 RepID=UPI003979AEE0
MKNGTNTAFNAHCQRKRNSLFDLDDSLGCTALQLFTQQTILKNLPEYLVIDRYMFDDHDALYIVVKLADTTLRKITICPLGLYTMSGIHVWQKPTYTTPKPQLKLF